MCVYVICEIHLHIKLSNFNIPLYSNSKHLTNISYVRAEQNMKLGKNVKNFETSTLTLSNNQ